MEAGVSSARSEPADTGRLLSVSFRVCVVVIAAAGLLMFGSVRVAAAPVNCPPGAASQGCPVPKRDLGRYLNIVGANAGPALPFVLGDAFRLKAGGRGRRLPGYDPGVCGSLLRSPNGRYLLYGTSLNGWPALELLDLATGSRSLFQARACDPAWGSHGLIAYLRYSRYSAVTGRYSGRIIVQHGLAGVPSTWTGAGAWQSPVWAGGSLLVGSNADAVIPGPLMIFYGPHHSRDVGEQRGGDRRPFSSVVAVNPQGTEALLDTERLGAGGGGAGAQDSAALIRISDDRILSTVVLNSNEAPGGSNVAALAPGGSWIGDQVLTTNGVFLGGSSHPPATLITLTVTGRKLRLRSVKQFIQNGQLPLTEDLDQASQATPLPGKPYDIAVWFEAIGQIRYLQCDTLTDHCTTSPDYQAAMTPTATFVTNPSRP